MKNKQNLRKIDREQLKTIKGGIAIRDRYCCNYNEDDYCCEWAMDMWSCQHIFC
ncbi:bacteriocin-like protein [Chryseobacterium sp.]|uniref:bacteriocin-like protein n=1 Tax=Chryseobacterium sp. TaxID=1871047 RepID=UPI002896A322|nr:hypothetical protein [Chryseobacterium sp.]